MNSTPVRRKYPRATIQEKATLTIREPVTKTASRLPVDIRSISCEGVGLKLHNKQPLEHRSTVKMDFSIDGRRFEIPGLIVWVASAGSVPGPLDVGVRFLLAAVPHETRQAYAAWVVNLLRRQGTSPAVAVP